MHVAFNIRHTHYTIGGANPPASSIALLPIKIITPEDASSIVGSYHYTLGAERRNSSGARLKSPC